MFRPLPYHPELTGVRLQCYPGSFYAVSARPFIVYPFSFHGVGTDLETPPDGDDWYSSSANPAGAMLSSGDSAKLRTVIDSQCTQWKICASDERKNDPGIRTISLLRDPQGAQFSPGKLSYNCHIDPLYDPNNFGELELDGTSANFCFGILIDDPLSPAYAAFLITDNAGNVKLTELHYSPPLFTRTPNTTPINFGAGAINADTCISLSFKNSESLSHTVLSAVLGKTSRFTITSIKPALPAILKKNNSVVFTLCFSPIDTLPANNNLNVVIDCFTESVPLLAKGSTGLIAAQDYDFGKVDTGHRVIHPMVVANIGKREFTLTKNWTIAGSKAFTVINPNLPVTLLPTIQQNISVQYLPMSIGIDTARIEWSTNISEPYTRSIKSYTRLRGQGIIQSSSVQEPVTDFSFRVRPNPASGNSIMITIKGRNAEKGELHIFDVLGREVYKQNSIIEANSEIPIRNLQNGIYYARLNIGGKILTEKFEVMR